MTAINNFSKPRFDFRLILLSSFVALSLGAISSFVGYDGLIIASQNSFSGLFAFLDQTQTTALFTGFELMLSFAPVVIISTENHTKRSIYAWAAAYPVAMLISISNMTVLPPLLAIGLCCILKTNGIKRCLARFALLTGFAYALNFIVYIARTGTIVMWGASLEPSIVSAMSIDIWVYWIVSIAFYIAYRGRGCKNVSKAEIKTIYSKLVNFFRLQRLYFQRKKHADQHRERVDRPILTLIVNILTAVIVGTVHIAQLSVVMATSAIAGGIALSIVVFLFGFFPQKHSPLNRYHYHAGNLFKCTLYSMASFYLVCAAAPSLRTSIIVPIVMGAAFALATAYYVWVVKELKNLDTMTPQEIETLIAELQPNELDASIIRKCWIEKKTVHQIATELCYSDGYIANQKGVCKKALTKLF